VISTGNLSFNINSISEIILLNNFIGEIECIIIENFDQNDKIDFRIDFKKESNLPKFNINIIYEDGMFEQIENNFYKSNNEIFDDQFNKYNYKFLNERN